jgi:hypothetical protein
MIGEAMAVVAEATIDISQILVAPRNGAKRESIQLLQSNDDEVKTMQSLKC